MRHWCSFYFFVDADKVTPLLIFLKQILAKLLEELCGMRCSYFFIRYNEDGFHIRLRIAVSSENQGAVEHFFLESFDTLLLEQCGFRAKIIQLVPYQPELVRYGGHSLINYAEDQFCSSTAISLHLIADEGQSNPIHIALQVNLAMLKASDMLHDERMELLSVFTDGWKRHLKELLYKRAVPQEDEETIWQHYKEVLLEGREDRNSLLKGYWRNLAETEDIAWITFLQEQREVIKAYENRSVDLMSKQQVISSFLHMNNNRAGVSNIDEVLVGMLLLDFFAFDGGV